MASSSALIFLFLGFVSTVAFAAEDTEAPAPSDRFSLSTEQLPSLDLTTLTNVAISAGAAALGVAGLAMIVILVLHLLGFKRCHLLGTCDALSAATAHFASANPLSAVGVSQGPYQLDNSPYAAYAVQQQQSSPAQSYQHEGNSFSKRSLEYVGPVLRTLADAYQKYGN